MHLLLNFILLLAVVLIASLAWIKFGSFQRKPGAQFFANAGIVNVSPEGQVTFPTADAAFATRYLICKRGAAATSINICGAADVPLGIVEDETPSDSDLSYPLNVALLGAVKGTRRGVAAAAIAADALIVPAAAGQVKTLPGATGTYWVIGKAFAAAAAQGDQVQFIPCFPYQVAVA